MTVQSTDRTAGPFTGNGVQTSFPFTFRVFTAADLLATVTDTSGNTTELVLSSDYIVSVNADQDGAPGGTLTMLTPLASGYKLELTTALEATQQTDITNAGGFYPQVVENALDKLTILLQQQGVFGRAALRVPEASGVPVLPAAVARANKILAFDGSGNPLMLVGVDSGSAAALQLLLTDPTAFNRGAFQIGRGFPVVDSIAALRNCLKTNPATRVFVAGYYAAGDGGGGPYYLDAADTTSTDNGGTIIVASDGGRWKLTLAGAVSVKQFGARGNYTGGALTSGQNDTAAIQAAINWAAANIDSVTYGSYSPSVGTGAVYFPQGSYGINSALIIPNKVCLFGEGQTEYTFGSRITQTNANDDLIRVAPGAGGTSFSAEKLIFRHNTGVGTGNLINMVRSGGGGVNSHRYVDCTFAQPANLALLLAGDDIVIDNCLFDVSSVSGLCIQLGTSTMACSQVRINNCNFFDIRGIVIKFVNIDGFTWGSGNTVSQPNSTTKTPRIFDAISFVPTNATNITIGGGTIKGPRQLFGGQSVTNVTINGVTVVDGGIGAGENLNMLDFTGTCSVNITGNNFQGSYDTKNFYTDIAATSVTGLLGGNNFINTGGPGDALSCTKFFGRLASNYYSGFTNQQIGEKRTTGGISPGNVSAGATVAAAVTVKGAAFGDEVFIGTISNAWLAPTGIDVRAFVNAADTVRVEYRNVTGSTINVPTHSIWVEVTR